MILLIVQIVVTLVLGLLVVLHLKQSKQRRICKDIPGPPIIPIIGNALQFTNDPEKIIPVFMQIVKKYGKIVQIWVGPTQMILITDIRVTEKILSSPKLIKKMDEIYQYTKPWLGNGLITNSENELWQKRRKMLTPAFHFSILEESLRIFASQFDQFLTNLEKHIDGAAFNIYSYGAYYALDVICASAMGIKLDAQIDSNAPYVHAIETILLTITHRFYSVIEQFDLIFNFSKNGRLHKQCLKTIHETANNVIKERRQLKQKNQDTIEDVVDSKKKHKAFLDILLDCTVDGRPLTDLEIREEVDNFMFAGYETLSKASAFLMYVLANHPEVQENVVEEIREELGDDRTKLLTMSDLNKLKYLDAVIKETLRMYPPGVLIGRKLEEDLEIENIKIPGNRGVILFIYGIHHDEDNFPDPETFKPERFLDGNPNKNPYAFIPFSAGPRNCIGQKYAVYGLKFIAVKILQHFELISGGPQHEVRLALTGILTPLNGVHVKIKSRQWI